MKFLYYKVPFSNVMYGILVAIWMVNEVVKLSGSTSMLTYLDLFIITVVGWVISIIVYLFSDNIGTFRDNEISDIKKSVLMMFIVCALSAFLIDFSKPVPPEPPKPIPDTTINITDIKTSESRRADKDGNIEVKYNIHYYSDNKVILTEIFKDIDVRDALLDRIYDQYGKFKVNIIYIANNNKQRIEIKEK